MGQPVIVDLAILIVVVALWTKMVQYGHTLLKLANAVVKLSEALQIMTNTQSGIIEELRKSRGRFN